ncbi:putative reverse transcriptase domain-containing protein [Tanacetum coccineum]
MRRKLDPREDTNRRVSNFTGMIKGMHVFVGNFTYVLDFIIIEDINSIIGPRLSQVVLGKPFVEISNMTHDPPKGVVRFTNGTDEIVYKMSYKIEQYNSLSDLEKENTKSVYLRNEEDKRRGVELNLMRRSLEVLRKFHWMTLGGRSNQLSHVSSPLLSKLGEYFLAVEWHLEEIHVTLAHLEKKLIRLQTYTKSLEESCSQSVETASQAKSDAVMIYLVTTIDYDQFSTSSLSFLVIFCAHLLCHQHPLFEIASGQLIEINKVIRGCKLEIEGHTFDIDVIPFGHGSFDVIVRMDWLSRHKAEIVCHEKVQFLRHVINGDGIHVDPNKIEAVKNWKAPRTLSKVCSFLGLARYYRRLIENFSKISKSLTILTQKSKAYDWEDFAVYCDASCQGLGCVLMQRGKVIAYASRQFKIHEKNYTTHDLKLSAVVFTLKIWRHCLYRTKSGIYTDHKSLQHIFNQKELNMRQRRWIELFSNYDYEIRYHSGLDEQMERRSDGALYYLDQIRVPLMGDVRTLIMDEAHKSKYSVLVYPGADKVYYNPRNMYWWPGMKTDIALERTIQTLEDKLRACVLDLRGSWDVHLSLVEFSYNNSYHSSIRCAPFEALYGRKCRSPILWAEIGEGQLIRPEIMQETTEKISQFKDRLKAARDRQKSYARQEKKTFRIQ